MEKHVFVEERVFGNWGVDCCGWLFLLDRAEGRARQLRPADSAAIAAPCDPRVMCLREAAPVLNRTGKSSRRGSMRACEVFAT